LSEILEDLEKEKNNFDQKKDDELQQPDELLAYFNEDGDHYSDYFRQNDE